MNRASNAGLLDANSQLPISFIASNGINSVATTTIVGAGPGIFHGFLVITTGAGTYNATLYDVSTTAAAGLVTSAVVGALATTTGVGAASPFQWGGDVIFKNGLVCVTAGSNQGTIKILYL